MAEWLASIMPNVVDYSGKFWSSCLATGQMFLIAGGFTLVLGGVFGVLLTVTKKGGIAGNAAVYNFVNIVTNVFRSIPFVILLIFLIPLTRWIVGTAIGVKGATPCPPSSDTPWSATGCGAVCARSIGSTPHGSGRATTWWSSPAPAPWARPIACSRQPFCVPVRVWS